MLPSISLYSKISPTTLRLIFVSGLGAPCGVTMGCIEVSFVKVAEVPVAVFGIMDASFNWIHALDGKWGSFASGYTAMWIITTFSVSLAEIICAIVVPQTILFNSWLDASIFISIFRLTAKCFCAIFKCWIMMANTFVTIFRITVFTCLFTDNRWVPATWWGRMGFTPWLFTMNIILSFIGITKMICAARILPLAFLSLCRPSTSMFTLIFWKRTKLICATCKSRIPNTYFGWAIAAVTVLTC